MIVKLIAWSCCNPYKMNRYDTLLLDMCVCDLDIVLDIYSELKLNCIYNSLLIVYANAGETRATIPRWHLWMSTNFHKAIWLLFGYVE